MRTSGTCSCDLKEVQYPRESQGARRDSSAVATGATHLELMLELQDVKTLSGLRREGGFSLESVQWKSASASVKGRIP